MNIQLKRLPEVSMCVLIELMNHPLIARHMPLLKLPFTYCNYLEFIEAKERMWRDHGYGPWGIHVDGHLAGWGGLQPENGEVKPYA